MTTAPAMPANLHPLVREALEEIVPQLADELAHYLTRHGGFFGQVALAAHFQNSKLSHIDLEPRRIYRGRSKGQPMSGYQQRRA